MTGRKYRWSFLHGSSADRVKFGHKARLLLVHPVLPWLRCNECQTSSHSMRLLCIHMSASSGASPCPQKRPDPLTQRRGPQSRLRGRDCRWVPKQAARFAFRSKRVCHRQGNRCGFGNNIYRAVFSRGLQRQRSHGKRCPSALTSILPPPGTRSRLTTLSHSNSEITFLPEMVPEDRVIFNKRH